MMETPARFSDVLCEGLAFENLDTSRYRKLLSALDDEHAEILRRLQSQIEKMKPSVAPSKLLNLPSYESTRTSSSEDYASPLILPPTKRATLLSDDIVEARRWGSVEDVSFPPKFTDHSACGEVPGVGVGAVLGNEEDHETEAIENEQQDLTLQDENVVQSPDAAPTGTAIANGKEGAHADGTEPKSKKPSKTPSHHSFSTGARTPDNKDAWSAVVPSEKSDKRNGAGSPSSSLERLRSGKDSVTGSADMSAVMSMINRRDYADIEEATTACQRWCAKLLRSRKFEVTIMFIILMNTVVMAAEMQFAGSDVAVRAGIVARDRPVGERFPYVKDVFLGFELFFTSCFAAELLFRFIARGRNRKCRFLKHPMTWLDMSVVVVGILGIVSASTEMATNSHLLRLVRVAKLFRGIRVIESATIMSSLHLISKSLRASMSVMGWSVFLLLVIQFVAAMVLCLTLQMYFEDASKSLEQRKLVFMYYGTFTRSVITMFEVTLGNWGPPCRIVMDNLHEAYALFFLVYRCIVGFAIVNVITAVFVQQTTRSAQADQEVMIVQKQKEKENYLAKLKQFFEAVDTSGDGFISLEEFSDMLSRPEVELWLSTLEVSLPDVHMLFQLIDDGDGQISIDEFVFGISRLRGNARSVDVMEVLMHLTKLEELVASINVGRKSIVSDKSPSGQSQNGQRRISRFSELACKFNQTAVGFTGNADTGAAVGNPAPPAPVGFPGPVAPVAFTNPAAQMGFPTSTAYMALTSPAAQMGFPNTSELACRFGPTPVGFTGSAEFGTQQVPMQSTGSADGSCARTEVANASSADHAWASQQILVKSNDGIDAFGTWNNTPVGFTGTMDPACAVDANPVGFTGSADMIRMEM